MHTYGCLVFCWVTCVHTCSVVSCSFQKGLNDTFKVDLTRLQDDHFLTFNQIIGAICIAFVQAQSDLVWLPRSTDHIPAQFSSLLRVQFVSSRSVVWTCFSSPVSLFSGLVLSLCHCVSSTLSFQQLLSLPETWPLRNFRSLSGHCHERALAVRSELHSTSPISHTVQHIHSMLLLLHYSVLFTQHSYVTHFIMYLL